MKISAIEIGTNSTKFAIAQLRKDNKFSIVKKSSTINRLSKDMYKDNYISKDAIESGIKIIGEYIEESKKDKINLVSIFSTSVLRDAENREEFSQKIKKLYGMDIEILSGEKEAQYSFIACRNLMVNAESPCMVIDIGGGSTEVIIGNKNKIVQKLSLDIGAVRMSELYIKTDPIPQRDIETIITKTKNEFINLGVKCADKVQLIGTGGSIKSIGTLFSDVGYKEEKAIHGVRVSKTMVETIYKMLSVLPIDERRKLKGLSPKRADTIIPGVLILLSAMEASGAEEITISSMGVIEGFLAYYLFNKYIKK